MSASLATAHADGPASAVVISKPPVPVLASDPPLGQVFEVEASLDRSRLVIDASRAGDQPIALSYAVVDADGTAYVTFDDGDHPTTPGGILVVPGWLAGEGGTATTIGGERTNLHQPKDIALVATHDGERWLAVADFGAAAVAVFDARASGDQPPLFVLPSGTGSVWGVLYDDSSERLFVSTTDGRLLVYDALPSRRGAGGPDRVVVPTLDGEQVSANLHGMSYHAASDTMIVTDVGPVTTAEEGPEFSSNGALLVIADASRADGPTPVRARIAGPSSMLGNPLDVELAANGSVLVTERANQLVLRFDGVLARTGNDEEAAPDAALSLPWPESLVRRP